MYFVWNLHDSFLSALAAMYCAFVPWSVQWYIGEEWEGGKEGGTEGRRGGGREGGTEKWV